MDSGPFDDTTFQDNEFAAAAVKEEESPIEDATEQADAATVANVTHDEVQSMCLLLSTTRTSQPVPGPTGLQNGAAATPSQSLSVEGMCTM